MKLLKFNSPNKENLTLSFIVDFLRKIVKHFVNKSYKLYLKSSKCLFKNSFVFLIITQPLILKNRFNKLFYYYLREILISPFFKVFFSTYYFTKSKSLNVKLICINFLS